MNTISPTISISEARSKLSKLTQSLKDDKYIILTKGGKAKAALVDIDFLKKLQADLAKLFQKTYIDPKLLSQTREFTDKEIKDWEQADELS